MSRVDAAASSKREPLSVFLSYSHVDKKYKDEIVKSLAFLRRERAVTIWHDREIDPGENWMNVIEERIKSANIVLLLISHDFIDSDYCWDTELKIALERKASGDAYVIPILIRPVDAGWRHTPLGALEALPDKGRPIEEWERPDEAYANVASRLRKLIENWTKLQLETKGERTYWRLTCRGTLSDFSRKIIRSITTRLRRAANTLDIVFLAKTEGSVVLDFESGKPAYEALKNLHEMGALSAEIKQPVLSLEIYPGPPPDGSPGAVLRIETRVVDGEFQSETRYLSEILGSLPIERGFPPLVGGISMPLDNPLAIGFSILTDGSAPPPTPESVNELQTRLGRYLNTMLVLSGEHLHVDLTPLDEYCGLPPLLRRTELGRDLLFQDVVLKHEVARLMHPSTVSGQRFWDAIENIASLEENALESCVRVWIIPDAATVQEKSENGYGHVTIEKLGLKVLCESDYATLMKIRPKPATKTQHEMDSQLFHIFNTHVLPAIQREVSGGPRFGLLRQILTVLIISKWVRESQLGGLLKRAGFLDSNMPRKYNLETVSDDVLQSLKQTYLTFFKDGVWSHTRMRMNVEKNAMERRLYLVGAIDARHS